MKKNKSLQPIIGIICLLVLLIPTAAFELTTQGQIGIKVTGMLVAGTFLGYVLSRSKFGFNGPIKKLVQHGDGRQAKALIYLFMITSIIAGLAIIGFGKSFFQYPLSVSLGVGTIVGGLLFGVGMAFSTGCASGTLSDLGDGLVPAALVLVFFLIGSTFGVAFYNSKADIDFVGKQGSSMSAALGSVSLSVIINLILLGVILAIVVIVHKWRALKKTQVLTPLGDNYQKINDSKIVVTDNLTWKQFFTFKTWERIFYKRWSWITGSLALAIWFAAIALGFKETPGITAAYARWGIFLTHGFGIDRILNWNGYYGNNLAIKNFMQDAQSWQNIGIIVGALIAKLFANNFKLSGNKNLKWHNWMLYCIGGLLMGVGARLARGCNFGALFAGISFQTGFGWVFGASLFLSSGITAVLIKKWHHETPGFVYKIKKK